MDERTVPREGLGLKEKPGLLSPPYLAPPYQCATAITVYGFVPHATIDVEVAGTIVVTQAVGFPQPDGATLALLFDWLMEPVAAQLGYWKWAGEIPFYNYLCWFIVAIVLLALFHFSRFNKQNKFAVHLLMIQVMFFLLLKTFFNA